MKYSATLYVDEYGNRFETLAEVSLDLSDGDKIAIYKLESVGTVKTTTVVVPDKPKAKGKK